jgi:predicted DNA-binding protein
MQKVHHSQAPDLPRKQQRIPIPLPQESIDRLEGLADQDGRPTANMGSMLIQAAIELIDQQGFSLVQGKLRKVAVVEEEPPG